MSGDRGSCAAVVRGDRGSWVVAVEATEGPLFWYKIGDVTEFACPKMCGWLAWSERGSTGSELLVNWVPV